MSEERFRGGPMASCSWELDALYYGSLFENRRLTAEWSRRNADHRVGQLARGEVPEDLPRPRYLDTTEWIGLLHLLESPAGLRNPFKAIDFRLDVLRALSSLPPSRLRAFVHQMDGYELPEIAELMASDGGEPWSWRSVRDAVKVASRTCRRHGDALLDQPTRRFSGVPETASADEVERRIEKIRRSRSRGRSAQRRAA